MIPALTRILLIGSASIAFLYVIFQIRNSNLTIRDSIFWVFFSIVLVLMAIFPEGVVWMSHLFKIETPTNFIFIAIIGVMIIRIYKMSITISSLNTKIKELTQSLAIQEYETNSKLDNKKTKKKN